MPRLGGRKRKDDGADGYTKGGQPILNGRRRDAARRFTPAPPGLGAAREKHLVEHLGPDFVTYQELVSGAVHLDVLVWRPTPQRPWRVLATSGMSDRAMVVPPGAEAFARTELVLGLPADWPLGIGGPTPGPLADERNYWPVRLLKMLAAFPHEVGTWIGWGHTVANPDPNETFAPGVPFTGALIGPPFGLCADVISAETPAGRVLFQGVFPITPSEMAFKTDTPGGGDALIDRLGDAGVSILVDPNRAFVA